MEQLTKTSVPYAVTEKYDQRDRQLYLLLLLPLCVVGLLLFMYILRKFRHDILSRLYLYVIMFICRVCLCQNLEHALSLDNVSVKSSSSGSKLTTSLKRRLSTCSDDVDMTDNLSDSKDSSGSGEITWDSVIESEADKIRKKIVFESDLDSKQSVLSNVSTPPSSIIDICSIHSTTDSKQSVVGMEEKSTQVDQSDLWISDCEDMAVTITPENKDYLITRSGRKFYKDI